MTRLKKGDICPLCGEPIETSDPFTLGYLSAWADLTPIPVPEFHADYRGEPFPFLAGQRLACPPPPAEGDAKFDIQH